MKRRASVKKLTTLSLTVAAAMLLSYIEHLLPSFVPIAGVKLGLANIATVFALYTLGRSCAIGVTLVRVLLSTLLFGNPIGAIYALSGAVAALLGMCLVSLLPIFSEIGVSTVGGVLHNVGQIIAAAVVMRTAELVTAYLPWLLISGTVAGVCIGIASGLLIKRLRDKI